MNQALKERICFLGVLLSFCVSGAQGTAVDKVIAPDQIVNAFKQGTTKNNCAAIALIKASIGTFGIGGVLLPVLRSDAAFTYRLRNGDPVALTAEEINYCTRNNGFERVGADPSAISVKNFSDTCFAVMCKRQQNLDGTTLALATARLNGGYKTPDIAMLLGVRFKSIGTTNMKKISTYPSLVIYNFFHAGYASNGVYDDAFNETGVSKVRHFKWNHSGNENNYILYLCDIKEAFEVVD